MEKRRKPTSRACASSALRSALFAHTSPVAEIAAECGFRSPETFIRAFRRRFGKTPSAYRATVRAKAASSDRHLESLGVQHFALSKTRIIDVRPMHVAFRRHVGPYESVPESLFDELERWAARRRLTGQRLWMGLGHDAPGVTPAAKLRFDAALVVPGPFEPSKSIGYQLVAGGPHAVTTHVGSYETLGAAYAKIFPRLGTFKEYDLVGLPVLEIYHTAKISVRYALNHTDICLPMRKKRAG